MEDGRKLVRAPFYSPPLADYTYRISVAVRVVGVEVWSVGRHLSLRCWSEGVNVVKGENHHRSAVGQRRVLTVLFLERVNASVSNHAGARDHRAWLLGSHLVGALVEAPSLLIISLRWGGGGLVVRYL